MVTGDMAAGRLGWMRFGSWVAADPSVPIWRASIWDLALGERAGRNKIFIGGAGHDDDW